MNLVRRIVAGLMGPLCLGMLLAGAIFSPPPFVDRSTPISERPFAKPFIDRGPSFAERPLAPIGGEGQGIFGSVPHSNLPSLPLAPILPLGEKDRQH